MRRREFIVSPAGAALQQATRAAPIVFVIVVDPVGAGFVEVQNGVFYCDY